MDLGFEKPIRVLVVDDHPIVRNGLRSLLAQYADIEVAGEAEDCAGGLECAVRLHPDVSLIDIKLENEDGLRLARRLLRQDPGTRIIILTSYDDEEHLVEAARLGVSGYLLKNASHQLLAEAIRSAAKGEKCISPMMIDKAFCQVHDLAREVVTLRFGLTAEDMKVLAFIAKGLNAASIAEQMKLSERTVKRRVQDILIKLGVNTRSQAIAKAYECGLL